MQITTRLAQNIIATLLLITLPATLACNQPPPTPTSPTNNIPKPTQSHSYPTIILTPTNTPAPTPTQPNTLNPTPKLTNDETTSPIPRPTPQPTSTTPEQLSNAPSIFILPTNTPSPQTPTSQPIHRTGTKLDRPPDDINYNYWKQFTKEQYASLNNHEHLGKPESCTLENVGNDFPNIAAGQMTQPPIPNNTQNTHTHILENTTRQGIKEKTQWRIHHPEAYQQLWIEYIKAHGTQLAKTAINSQHVYSCTTVEQIHPQIPVVRVRAQFFGITDIYHFNQADAQYAYNLQDSIITTYDRDLFNIISFLIPYHTHPQIYGDIAYQQRLYTSFEIQAHFIDTAQPSTTQENRYVFENNQPLGAFTLINIGSPCNNIDRSYFSYCTLETYIRQDRH